MVESKALESFYGSVTIFNESSTEIEETFNFDRLDNFKIVDYQGKPKFDVSCLPGEVLVILLQRLSEKAAGMHFQSAIKPAASAKDRVFGAPGAASKFPLSSSMFGDEGSIRTPNTVFKPKEKLITPM